MASKNIKGITIEIGGNTTKLQDALKGVDKQVYSLNSDLKALDQALKLNPKNTELLAQKQDVLRRNIQATTERLNTLKEAQRQMGDYNKLTDEQKTSYNQLSVEIAKSEKALKDMNKELKATSGIDISKLKDGLKKVGDVALDVTKKLGQVTAAVSGMLAGIVAAGVKSYAEFEQVNEGAKLLFGDGYDYIAEQSKKAASTMGMSANEYLQQVNGLAVGLKTALGGNEQAAAELANKVLTAEADIVAATGNTQENVQNAFNGIMKGNFTMLDNLQLGIKPTKEGMQEVIDKVNEWNKAQGEATDYQMGNYADMQAALVDYVEMQGIAGYAANEAADTITGSVNSMKAAFDNFLNGSGGADELATSITNVLKNIGTAISKLAPSILSGIVTLIQTLLPQVVQMLMTMIPQLLTAVQNMINTLLTMLLQNTTAISTAITNLINLVIQFLTTNLPLILQAGITILLTLVDGIIGAIPTLAEALPQVVTTIINVLIENIPLVLEAAIQLLMALVEAIPVIIEALVDALPTIVDTIITTLLDNLPMLLEACVKLFMALVEAIPKVIIELVKVVPTIVTSVVKTLWDNRGKILEGGKKMLLNLRDGIINNLSELMTKVKEIPSKVKGWIEEGLQKLHDVGDNFVKGIWQGISDGLGWIKGKLKEWVGNVVDFCKKILGIKSPSKVMADSVGKYMAEGIGVGFEDEMDYVEKEMAKSIPIDSLVDQVNGAMRGLNQGINASVNPTINPNITMNQNYELMAQAMKEALSEVEVSLDDREVGKFVTKTITEEIYN